MKTNLLTFIFAFLCSIPFTGLHSQTIFVKQNSGSQTAYALSSIQKMTFSSGNLNVQKTDNSTGTFALSGLKNLSFSASNPPVSPTAYNVTGGGNYCSIGTPVNVGLDGSELSRNYQFYKDGVAFGSAIAGTGNALSIAATGAGAYTCKETNGAGTTMNGSVNVTVTNALTASVSIAPDANNVTSGTSVLFYATPTNGGSSPTYQWKINGTIAGSNSSNLYYVPNNNDVVTCTLTSNAVCVTNNPTTSSPVTMVVNPVVASVKIIASSNPFCTNTSVTYIAIPTNGGTSPTFQWKVNGNNVGTDSNTFSYIPSNHDSIKCILTSSVSPVIGSPAISNTIHMTVTDTLSVAITASQNYINEFIDIPTFHAVASSTQNITYQWMINGFLMPSDSAFLDLHPIYFFNDLDSVYVIVTADGCAANSTATSNKIIMHVLNMQSQKAIITVNDSDIVNLCPGGIVKLLAKPNNYYNTEYQYYLENSGTPDPLMPFNSLNYSSMAESYKDTTSSWVNYFELHKLDTNYFSYRWLINDSVVGTNSPYFSYTVPSPSSSSVDAHIKCILTKSWLYGISNEIYVPAPAMNPSDLTEPDIWTLEYPRHVSNFSSMDSFNSIHYIKNTADSIVFYVHTSPTDSLLYYWYNFAYVGDTMKFYHEGHNILAYSYYTINGEFPQYGGEITPSNYPFHEYYYYVLTNALDTLRRTFTFRYMFCDQQQYAINTSMLNVISKLSVQTNGYTNNIQTSAILHGTIISNGGDANVEHGFIVSANANPTLLSGTKYIASGLATGNYSDTITGLNPNSYYYYRAYAVSTIDTVYGVTNGLDTRNVTQFNGTGLWSDATKWTNGVPTSTSTVFINGSCTLAANGLCYWLGINKSGALTINSGDTLNVTNFVYIYSTATSTGAILQNGVLNVLSHNIEAERYASASKSHFVSSPLTNAIAQTFQGSYLNAFNESTAAWMGITSINIALNVGQGYSVYNAAEKLYKFKGSAFNRGDIALTSGPAINPLTGFPRVLSYTNVTKGSNLVGNPYACRLNGNINTWIKNNISNSIQVFDPIANAYLSWNGVTGTPGFNGLIAENQGFFVKATGPSPILIIPASSQSISSANFKSFVPNQLGLTVNGNGYSDGTRIYFNAEATEGTDNQLDAEKMFGPEETPQLFSITPDNVLSINCLPEINENVVVPVGLKVGANALYTITATDLESFNAGTQIYLEDLKAGKMINLTEQNAYTFDATTTDNANRFKVHFGNASTEKQDATINAYAFENTVYVNNPSLMKINEVVIYNTLGQVVTSFKPEINSITKYNLNLANGSYIIKMVTENNVISNKINIK